MRLGVQQVQQSRLRMGGGTGARGVATCVGKQNSLFAALAARGEMGRRSLGGQGLTTEGAMGIGRGQVAVPGHPQRSHGGWDSGPLHSPGGPNTGGGVGGAGWPPPRPGAWPAMGRVRELSASRTHPGLA